MRAEVEQAYQGGGDVTVDDIIKRSTDPVPGENLTQMIMKRRDDALERLRAGQSAIAERRAQREQEDERAKWLALAQGMLAPTKTGGFGESLGATAGLLRQEQALSRQGMGDIVAEEQTLAKQEADVEEDYIDQLQAQARIEKTPNLGEFSRPRPIGTEKLYPHPEDPKRLARGQQIWRPDKEVPALDEQGQPMLDEQGQPIIQLGGTEIQYLEETGPDGSIPFAVDRLDFERSRILTQEKKLAEAQADRLNNDIMGGRDAWPMIQKYEKTIELMREVEKQGLGTGGWVALLQGVSEWFGVDTKDVTNMGVLRNRLGQAVLNGLQHFPGQISEGERKYMEALETGLAKPLGVNMALIEEGLRIQRARHRRGVKAARAVGLPLDLEAMGIDPNAPDAPPAGSIDAVRQNQPGSSRQNPVDASTLTAAPPAGTWVQLPSGEVKKYRGAPTTTEAETGI